MSNELQQLLDSIRQDANRKALRTNFLNRVLLLDGDDEKLEALCALARVILEEHPTEATSIAKLGLEIRGDHIECLKLYALGLRAIGRHTKAQEVITHLEALDPGFKIADEFSDRSSYPQETAISSKRHWDLQVASLTEAQPDHEKERFSLDEGSKEELAPLPPAQGIGNNGEDSGWDLRITSDHGEDLRTASHTDAIPANEDIWAGYVPNVKSEVINQPPATIGLPPLPLHHEEGHSELNFDENSQMIDLGQQTGLNPLGTELFDEVHLKCVSEYLAMPHLIRSKRKRKFGTLPKLVEALGEHLLPTNSYSYEEAQGIEELLRSLWEENPSEDAIDLIQQLPFLDAQPKLWCLYLDCLIAGGQARHAVHCIRSMLKDRQETPWPALAYHKLLKACEILNLRPPKWEPHDGGAKLHASLLKPLEFGFPALV